MAREFLRVCKETSFGTVDTALTNPYYIQLTDANQFTMRPAPMVWELRSAGGHNRRVQRGSSKMSITGSLGNLVVYGSQVPWLKEALTPNATTWVLPSYTFDHGIIMDDGSSTAVYRRYIGCTVSQAAFSCTADNQLLRVNLDFIGKDFTQTMTSPTFTEPAVTAYPGYSGDYPLVIEHVSTSSFTLHSANTAASNRTEFDNFNLTIKHQLDPTFFNSTRITRLKCCGRDVDGSVNFPYIEYHDRTDFEAATTAFTASVGFASGTTPHATVLTFTMNGVNYLTAVSDVLDYNKVFLQGLTWATYMDSSVSSGDATADLSITGTYS